MELQGKSIKKIGLIAGGGQFPLLFARKAKLKGYEVHAAAYVNEADTTLADHVDSIQLMHLGQIGRLLSFFKRRGITEAVMLGTIQKTRIFTDIKPDLKALAFIARMGHTHDDSILRAFADLIESHGVAIKPSTFLFPELVSPKGCWTKRGPDKAEMKDIKAGWPIARQIGKLDVGQAIVVGNGTVLAVEAADGTDATIRRGGSLGKGKSVLVKLCKPIQDRRFDLPTTGAETIEIMAESGLSVLALEAGKTISFDRERMIALADEHGISIVAMDEAEFK